MLRVLLFIAALATVRASAFRAPETRRAFCARYIKEKTINRAKTDFLAMASKIKNSLDVEDTTNSRYENPTVLRGGGEADAPSKFCGKLLAGGYTACGLAATAAWSTIVYTTIRSNQPLGAMMPSWQHQFYARIGAMSAVPLIGSAFYTLASSASKSSSWDGMSTPTCRRHNLAIAASSVASALWVGFAPIITKIPGTDPLVSHQIYKGAMRAGLIGCYGSAAALGAAVWARTLPEDVRGNPFKWPGHIADGVSKSLMSLAPACLDNPVNVKYSLLASSFLIFTGLQLGSHPLSAIPTWTGRRCSRAFAAWTILGATTAFDLKEATENDTLGSHTSRALSNGLKGFGSMYLLARAGCVLLDPSWPHAYHAITQVPAWATAAIFMTGLALRSDKKDAPYYIN